MLTFLRLSLVFSQPCCEVSANISNEGGMVLVSIWLETSNIQDRHNENYNYNDNASNDNNRNNNNDDKENDNYNDKMRKWKPVAFNSDISEKFAAAHGTKFAIPGQRKCRLICNVFPIDRSDYN